MQQMKKLKINRFVYSDEAIEATMQAYRHLAMITAKVKGDYTILTFWKCKYGDERTIKEFENYLIGIENS